MNKTEFLVIFPTFGNLDVVKKTLPTVIEEVKKNDAMLIVHDSTDTKEQDEKWEYLRKVNKENDFFLILSTNLSMASARNMCLSVGQEIYCPDYICMIEDDHGFHDGLIKLLIEAMKNNYGKISPNGLRYGMFSGCTKHTHSNRIKINDLLSYSSADDDPFTIGGFNSCFRCAPTQHWNNVLKGYDTDEYLISEYQTKHLRWRNYHKGFTVLYVGDGKLVFDVDSIGRGLTGKNKLKLWDNDFCASDLRSKFVGKKLVSGKEHRLFNQNNATKEDSGNIFTLQNNRFLKKIGF